MYEIIQNHLKDEQQSSESSQEMSRNTRTTFRKGQHASRNPFYSFFLQKFYSPPPPFFLQFFTKPWKWLVTGMQVTQEASFQCGTGGGRVQQHHESPPSHLLRIVCVVHPPGAVRGSEQQQEPTHLHCCGDGRHGHQLEPKTMTWCC